MPKLTQDWTVEDLRARHAELAALSDDELRALAEPIYAPIRDAADNDERRRIWWGNLSTDDHVVLKHARRLGFDLSFRD